MQSVTFKRRQFEYAMKTIIVCVNHRSNPNQPSCGARGGADIADYIEHKVSKDQLQLSVERFNCLGFCEQGPNLKIAPEGCFIHGVKIEALPDLLRELANSPAE